MPDRTKYKLPMVLPPYRRHNLVYMVSCKPNIIDMWVYAWFRGGLNTSVHTLYNDSWKFPPPLKKISLVPIEKHVYKFVC